MSVGGGIGGLTPQDNTPQAMMPQPGSVQPPTPASQQPGYNQVTDYSLGFGRIFQQPSFYNPFAGYSSGGFGGSPFGGFGGGFGGGLGSFGGFGGFGGGLGSMYPSYPPMQFGPPAQVPPYRAPQPRNPYVKPVPTLPEPMPPRDGPDDFRTGPSPIVPYDDRYRIAPYDDRYRISPPGFRDGSDFFTDRSRMNWYNPPSINPPRDLQPYDFGTPYVSPGGSISPFEQSFSGGRRFDSFGNQYLV